MEIGEHNRHRIRTQIIKIIAHLHEARRQLTLCEDHDKVVRNAGKIEGIATLQLDTGNISETLDSTRQALQLSISECVRQADVLRNAMDNPYNTPPPITGRFLSLAKLTESQRQMVRAGDMPYSDCPTNFGVVPTDQNKKPPKPRKVPDPPPKRVRRKPDSRMPI